MLQQSVFYFYHIFFSDGKICILPSCCYSKSQFAQKLYLNMMYVGIDQIAGLSDFVQRFLSLSKMFRLLQIQDAGHIHSGPSRHRRVSRYVTLRSYAICTGDAFHDARLRDSCTRSFLYTRKYLHNCYIQGNGIVRIDTTAYVETYYLPVVSIISPQTEGMLFRTPHSPDTRPAFLLYSSLVKHPKDLSG